MIEKLLIIIVVTMIIVYMCISVGSGYLRGDTCAYNYSITIRYNRNFPPLEIRSNSFIGNNPPLCKRQMPASTEGGAQEGPIKKALAMHSLTTQFLRQVG